MQLVIFLDIYINQTAEIFYHLKVLKTCLKKDATKKINYVFLVAHLRFAYIILSNLKHNFTQII